MYTNTYKLMGKLKVAKAKGDILKELRRIEKTDVLILEDFCMHPFDAGSRMSLMDIIEDRYGKKTTILTSQVPVKNWYDLIGDKTVADAVLDRLVLNALRIELHGASLRKLLNMKNTTFDTQSLKLNPHCIRTQCPNDDRNLIFSQVEMGVIFTPDCRGSSLIVANSRELELLPR